MLGNILIGAAGVVGLFLVVAARRPSAYHVERKLELAAPAERVFAVLNDLRQFAGVLVMFREPLLKPGSQMQTSFEGPAGGVGQSFSWTSKKDGTGKLTIEESVPGQKVGMRLDFVKPMESTASCVLTLAGTPTGTLVTWSMAGNHNFVGKAFGVFMNLDNMLGADLEKSLARLKTVAEGKPLAAAAGRAV